MKNLKIRIGLIIFAIVIIIAEMILIDYGHLTSSKNLAHYLVIVAMIGLIASMIIQIRYDKKQQAKLKANSNRE